MDLDKDEMSGEFSVREAARALDVSERRVRALIETQEISARRVRGRWLVSRDCVARRMERSPSPVRPLGARSLEVLLSRLDVHLGADSIALDSLGVTAVEQHRTMKRMSRLMDEERPARLLRAWARRGWQEPQQYWAPIGVWTDSRVQLTGASKPGTGLFAPAAVEVHIDRIPQDWSTAHSPICRVPLAVYQRRGPLRPAMALVDLAQHGDARADDAVDRILHGARS